MLRRRRPPVPAEVARAYRQFRMVVEQVEEAKATLLLGVPSGRSPWIPLAEALAGFERGIAQARAGMAAWQAPQLGAEWEACLRALDDSADGAERVRLGTTPEVYEELVPVLDALLDPLGAFAAAAGRFRELGA